MKNCLVFLLIMLSCVSVAYGDTGSSSPKPLRIAASSGTLSTFTETPAGDSLIPNSQIFVGGQGGGARFLGLIGVILDTAANSTVTTQKGKAGLAISFKETLTAALQKVVDENERKLEYTVLTPDASSDLLILPYARLNADDLENTSLTFSLAVRSKTKEGGGARKTTNYHLPITKTRTLEEGDASWTANSGAAIIAEAAPAFERLAKTLIAELSGAFEEEKVSEKLKKVRWQAPGSSSIGKAAVIGSTEGHLIAVPLGTLFGGRLPGHLFVLDPSLLEVD